MKGVMSLLIEPPDHKLKFYYESLLTPEALKFLYDLCIYTKEPVNELYLKRERRKLILRDGKSLPSFPENSHCRIDKNWKVSPLPKKLKDRRLDLGDVSPTDGKRFAEAINQPVQGIQVDFDDGHCPNWKNQLKGIWNVVLAVNGKLPGAEKQLKDMPLLVLRPRAWNIIEHNVLIHGQEIPGPLFDIAMLMFHCGRKLYEAEVGPCLYLSKLEGFEEARLWNNIFVWIQNRLDIPIGTIKACVLIENILSSFEMDEILWELRMHSMGLNCGIWDYAASIIAKFGTRNDFILPDRNKYVNMDRHFMKSYMRLVIDTCHLRGAYATGGMAAQIITSDLNKKDIVNTVVTAKRKEILAGVDGFMVYDMQLIPSIIKLWNEMLPVGEVNQLGVISNISINRDDLLRMPKGGVTHFGLDHNIRVAILFIWHWSFGHGHFIYRGAVEDSATAEISRSQIWQWIRHECVDAKLILKKICDFKATLEENSLKVTRDLIKSLAYNFLRESIPRVKTLDEKIRLQNAYTIFMEMITMRNSSEFITTYLNDFYINRESIQEDVFENLNESKI